LLRIGGVGVAIETEMPAVHRNMRICGRSPSAGVVMSALLRSPVLAPAWAWTSSGSLATPPRP
jgi:hypothetical protein